MTPPLVSLLAWSALLSIPLVFAVDRELRLIAWKRPWVLALLMLTALVWRLPRAGEFFYGLEYEDAYVYSVVGRYLSEGVQLPTATAARYLTTVCAVGSSENCIVPDTFSGHYLGYPYLIAIASSIVDYRAYTGTVISITASVLTVLPIAFVGRMVDRQGISSEAAGLLYSITPVFAVYGVGAYAEPVSNLFVVLSLLFFARLVCLRANGFSHASIANWVALNFVALFAVMIKRENFILLPVLALSAPTLPLPNSGVDQRRWWALLAISAALSLAVAIAVGIPKTIESETGENGIFPFSWITFGTMLPLFFESFAKPTWYLLSLPLVVAGALAWTRSGERRWTIVPAALFASYLLLYASHVRSYYQLQTGRVHAFDTIRYSMNLSGLWSVLAGVGASLLLGFAIQKWGSQSVRRWRFPLTAGLIALTLFAYVETARQRQEMVLNESLVRWNPMRVALRLARSMGPSTFLITHEPLLVPLLTATPINVIDARYLDRTLLRELRYTYPRASLLYLDEAIHRSEDDRKRYAALFGVLDRMAKTSIAEGDGFSLYLLSPSDVR